MSRKRAITQFIERLELLSRTKPQTIELTEQQIAWCQGLIEKDHAGRMTFKGIDVRVVKHD